MVMQRLVKENSLLSSATWMLYLQEICRIGRRHHLKQALKKESSTEEGHRTIKVLHWQLSTQWKACLTKASNLRSACVLSLVRMKKLFGDVWHATTPSKSKPAWDLHRIRHFLWHTLKRGSFKSSFMAPALIFSSSMSEVPLMSYQTRQVTKVLFMKRFVEV